MPLLLLALILLVLLILADFLIRLGWRKLVERRRRAECRAALDQVQPVPAARAARSLKRAEVPHPRARLLCVDDEPVILDSFRKMLVPEGYSVDTVESGPEALDLVPGGAYDFVFTDLKMPELDGVAVTRAVQQLRPDMDLVIITGFATIETAVECMKLGAADYVQKPFTEDELLQFVRRACLRRQDRLERQLEPRVRIAHSSVTARPPSGEFVIPGGAFLSRTHTWTLLSAEGDARIGLDDFAHQMLRPLDALELPAPGTDLRAGDPLFTARQGDLRVPFPSPLSGRVLSVNHDLARHPSALAATPYGDNWVCCLRASDLATELPRLTIGQAAADFLREEFRRWRQLPALANLDDHAVAGRGLADHLPPDQRRRLAAAFFQTIRQG